MAETPPYSCCNSEVPVVLPYTGIVVSRQQFVPKMVKDRLHALSLLPMRVNVLFFLASFSVSFSTVAFTALFYTTLKLEPAQATNLYASFFLPYQCRSVLSLLSDVFPIFGLRRKPYMLIGLLGAGLSYVAVGLWATDYNTALCFGVMLYIFSALSSIMFETYLVEWAQGSQGPNAHKANSNSINDSAAVDEKAEQERKNRRDNIDKAVAVQTASYTFQTLGDLAGFVLAIPLNKRDFDPRLIIALSSTASFLAFLLSFGIHEAKIPTVVQSFVIKKKKIPWKHVLMIMKQNIGELLFLLVVFGLPAVTDTWSGYVYHRFTADPATLNLFSVIGSLGTLLGLALFALVSRSVNLRLLFLLGIVANFCLSSLPRVAFATNFQFGLSDHVFLGTASFFSNVATQMRFMPVVLMATLGSSHQLESVFFSIYFTVVDGADQIAARLSAVMTTQFHVESPNFLNAEKLFLICGLISLSSIVLLFLVPMMPTPPKLDDSKGKENSLNENLL